MPLSKLKKAPLLELLVGKPRTQRVLVFPFLEKKQSEKDDKAIHSISGIYYWA